MTGKRQSDEPKQAARHQTSPGYDDKDRQAGKPAEDKAPGKGKPDREEGVGTVQNQKR